MSNTEGTSETQNIKMTQELQENILEPAKKQIAYLKTKVCDLVLQFDDEKTRLVNEANIKNEIMAKVSKKLGLENPTIDQLFARIDGLQAMESEMKKRDLIPINGETHTGVESDG